MAAFDAADLSGLTTNQCPQPTTERGVERHRPRARSEWNPPRQAISRVPYLPGLDGMRALAVVAVMIYHTNNGWLPGGFIGVEVFFVISGYLITLLLIGEHEKHGRIDLKQFWLRRRPTARCRRCSSC